MFSRADDSGRAYILLHVVPASGRHILHRVVESSDDLIVRFGCEAVHRRVEILRLRHVDEDGRQEVFCTKVLVVVGRKGRKSPSGER